MEHHVYCSDIQVPSDILLGGGKAPKGGREQGDCEERALIVAAGEADVVLAAICERGGDQKDIEVQIAQRTLLKVQLNVFVGSCP